jgi:hypothetical protein
MRALTTREERTIRLAAIGVAVYLVLFLGLKGCSRLEASRSDYHRLVSEAQRLKREFQPYENKVLQAQKLKETLRLDLSKLSKATVVAEASAAIQQAAKSGGIQLGPIRESPARAAARELTSIQLEGVGPVPAVMTFLHRIDTVGFPLVVDAVQISAEPTKPGMIKLSLTIVILDFEQWKTGGPA